MPYQTILFNELGRLRSGWRLGIFLILFVVFGTSLQIITDFVLKSLPIGYSGKSFLSLSIGYSLSLTVAIAAGFLCGKYLENLPFRALGVWFTENWLIDLLFGLAFGAFAISLAVLIAVVFGGLSFDFNAAGQSAILLSLGVSLVIFALAAAFEEALFRGYMLQTFARAGLAWFAIALTAAVFASVHLGNPGATWISTTNTALAGIWFGIAYLRTRTLWFVFGLHFMWNWMQGAFFGIEVSGLREITTAPLLTEIDRGPIWLTGESYGIEGGIACTISLIVFILLVWYLPIFKPTAEMLELTNKENPKNELISNDNSAKLN